MSISKQSTPPRDPGSKKQSVATGSKATKSAQRAVKADAISVSKSGTTKRTKPARAVDKEQRREMIAEAAYYRFASRGYVEGGEMEDWLAAEEEINRMLDLS